MMRQWTPLLRNEKSARLLEFVLLAIPCILHCECLGTALPASEDCKQDQRATRTCKTCACSFQVVLAFLKKPGCWVISKLNFNHFGHPPRIHLPFKFHETDVAELATWKNVHGMATTSMLSLLREEGKLVTSKNIFNAIHGYCEAKNKGCTESEILLREFCNDTATVFVVRLHICTRVNTASLCVITAWSVSWEARKSKPMLASRWSGKLRQPSGRRYARGCQRRKETNRLY